MLLDPARFVDGAASLDAARVAAPRMLFLWEGPFGDRGVRHLATAPWKPTLIRAYLVFLALSRLGGGPVSYDDVEAFGEFPSRQSAVWHLGRLVALGAVGRAHVPLEGTLMYARLFALSEERLLRSLGLSEEAAAEAVSLDAAGLVDGGSPPVR